MRQDKERAVIRPAEDKIKRPFRHIDSLGQFSIRAINKHLARGEIDVSVPVLRKTLSALFRKELKAGDGSVSRHISLVSSFLRFFGHVERMSGNRLLQAEASQYVGHLRSPRHIPLKKIIPCRDEGAAVRREKLPRRSEEHTSEL